MMFSLPPLKSAPGRQIRHHGKELFFDTPEWPIRRNMIEVSVNLEWGRSELYNSAAHCNCNSLGAVTRAELVHNVLEVHFDGLLGNEEPLGNIPVPISAVNVPQDVHFAFS